jgi:flagellar basal body-associated protein FliL
MKKKIGGILQKVFIFALVLPIVGINLAIGYIMFAPDNWWKPFYLNYYYKAEAAAPTQQAPVQTQPAHPQPSSKKEEPKSTLVSPPPSKAQVEIEPGQGIMFDTGTKIVNLAEPTGRKIMRVSVVLEFAPTDLTYYSMTAEEKAAFVTSFNDEITKKMPVISNALITLLSSQTFESVYTVEGKEKLRQMIMQNINANLPENRVIFVYFTEFVIQ